MNHLASIGDLRPGDVIVASLDETAGRYSLDWRNTPPTSKRVTATVVETLELDDTGTTGETIERDGTIVLVLGKPNDWRLRIMIDGKRYTLTVDGRHFYERLEQHHPVCVQCGEPWPCREQRIDAAATRFARELEDVCNHCGQRIGSAWSATFYDGTTLHRYHQAKKYRANGVACRDAYAAARDANKREVHGA